MDSRDDQGRPRSHEFARDRHGNPLVDRYGRPVRRRDTTGGAPRRDDVRSTHRRAGGTGAHARPEPPRYVRSSENSGLAAQQQPPRQAPRQRMAPSHQPLDQPPRYPSAERAAADRVPASYGRNGITGRPRAPRTARPRRGFRLGRALGVLLLVVLVVGAGSLFWADNKLNRVDALQNYDGRIGNTSGTNWLLVGSDSRAGLDADDAHRLMAGELDDSSGRTDTIMIIHLPRGGGQARMVSVPRDSWVNIPGHGEDKVNAAFALGGAPLLQQTLEEATGLRLDHYAEIGFGGFANAVDGVGGIKMCIDEPLDDPMAGINLPAGCQKLNGPDALGFVRSRYASANGDLDRIDRQKQFLASLSKKIMSPMTLLNPFRLFPTVGGVAEALTVDKKDHMWHLAWLGVKMRNAKQESVPTAGGIDTWAGNALLWDDQAAEALFSDLR